MARKKNREFGLVSGGIGLFGAGLGLGVGSTVIGGVGGPTAAAAQGGLTTAASFLPVGGTIIGAGVTVNLLRNLEQSTRRPKQGRRCKMKIDLMCEGKPLLFGYREDEYSRAKLAFKYYSKNYPQYNFRLRRR